MRPPVTCMNLLYRPFRQTTSGVFTVFRTYTQSKTSNPIFLNVKQFVGCRNFSSTPKILHPVEIPVDLNSRENVDTFLKEFTDDQKMLIYQSLHVEVMREKYMNELASESHYLSRFGRPSASHVHGRSGTEDPTGTFTEIAPSWLSDKSSETKAKSSDIPSKDLLQVGLKNALPFVGFGFLDNLIMIVAGDYIDLTIGTMLGISTMAAAALGNTISDVAGIASAWYVEYFADRIGLRDPVLTEEQQNSRKVRWIANLGRALGVVIGCLLGMIPLLFLTTNAEKEKKGGH